MKLTSSQARHIQLTSRISRQAETLSALSAEDMKNPTDEVLMTTDQFEDDLIEFLQLTGRLHDVLESHIEDFADDIKHVIKEYMDGVASELRMKSN